MQKNKAKSSMSSIAMSSTPRLPDPTYVATPFSTTNFQDLRTLSWPDRLSSQLLSVTPRVSKVGETSQLLKSIIGLHPRGGVYRPNYVEDPSGILHYLAASPCQLTLTECPALHGVASSALYHMTTRSITYDVVCFVVRDVTTSQSDANTVCTICNRAIVMLFTITVTDEFLLHTPMGTGSVAPEFNSRTRRCRVSVGYLHAS